MQIFVKDLSGQSHTLEVNPSGTVESLKAKVEELLGPRAREQRLVYCGRQFRDGHRLSDYNIPEFATVHLSLRLLSCRRCPSCVDKYIYVQTRTSNIISLQVEPSDTVAEVRKKINGHQSLFLAGTKLEDHRTFGYYYEIENNATLHLDFGTQIFVKMVDGNTFSVEVDPAADTVGDLKAKIQDQQKEIMDQQMKSILFICHRLDDDQRKLASHKIQNYSTLHLAGCMQITVKTLPLPRSDSEAMIRFKVPFAEKIGDFKAKIQDQQRLLFNGRHLVDGEKTLADYVVQGKSTLLLDCPMQVFVTVTLEVDLSDTIDHVKERIGGHDRRLTFDGNELDDGKTYLA